MTNQKQQNYTETPQPKTLNPREAAYLALLAAMREERFIADTLEKWAENLRPTPRDFHLAQQLAYGASQMALALDYLAEQSSKNKKLSLKGKERALLHIALYQHYFLDRVPLYAITDEMVKLARKYCHARFISYLNAMLRQLSSVSIQNLPQGDSIRELSIRYSYPIFFVEGVVKDYGLSQAKEILELGNLPSPTMVRVRPGHLIDDETDLQMICKEPCLVARLKDTSSLFEIARSPDYYIQNVTPAFLMGQLCCSCQCPGRVLDLCASPGGKLVALHDFFPEALLFANDVSADKIQRLSENCSKYGISPVMTCGKGEDFASKGQELFDVIILDVPCSNTGVLNKRPEARWRLSKVVLDDLEKIQLNLIEHAITLLEPQGELWYMTCSILKSENEKMVKNVCERYGLSVSAQYSVLPNRDGWDGGYACALFVSANTR